MPTEVFVRTLRGLESFASTELRASFGATVIACGHRLVHAQLDDALQLTHAGSIDDAFVLITRLHGIGRHRAALDALREVDLGHAAGTFEVVASFVGKRNYNRFEIEDAIGLGHKGYRTRREGPVLDADVSYRVVIEDDLAWIGRRIADRPLHRRAYKIQTPPASLHPPLAFAMCMLAGIEPGTTVLDPCCGAGTIPIEATRFGAHAIGVERDAEVVRMARANGAMVVAGDAATLPVARVDRVIANPPWGRQAHGGIEPREIARVTDRSVLLTQEPIDGAYPAFEHRVSVSGRWVDLVVWGDRPFEGPLARLLEEALA